MAEDERAAKAARAKAMLKKRQQQKKAAGNVADSSANTPSPPLSRTLSPAPSQTQATNDTNSIINEFGEILSPKSPPGNTQNLASTTSVEQTTSNEKDNAEKLEEYSKQLQDQSQTISLLVSEKASLVETLEKLQGIDSKFIDTQAQLVTKDKNLRDLQADLSRIHEEKLALESRLETSEGNNAQMTSKLREQERGLHSCRQEAEALRSQLQSQERRTRELEEQIHNDDRVEVLEKTLKNTQDRAEDLSFQLSKLKQSYDKLKTEHDHLREQLEFKTKALDELSKGHTTLQSIYANAKGEISSLTTERNSILAEREAISDQLQRSQDRVAELQNSSAQSLSDVATLTRQLESAQSELRATVRRADDAGQSQQRVQEEARGLMDSLNELRPKVVALTGEKLELIEKAEHLTRSLSQRDATITELEALLDQSQQADAESRELYSQLSKKRESERFTAEKTLGELQQSYAELQHKYDEAVASTRELETDRTRQRQIAVRQQEEIDSLQVSLRGRIEEVLSLQEKVDEQEHAEADSQRLLEELQGEVEALRNELVSKEDEVSRIRQAVASPSPSPDPQNLNDEVQSAVKQQYVLELSTSQSRIRSLETAVYDAESKQLSLQRQLAAQEDELIHLRAIAESQKQQSFAHYDPHPGRGSDDLRRTSSASNRSDSMRMRASHLIDESLPPSTQHQRHVSLAMLQARMFSEAEAASIQLTSKTYDTETGSSMRGSFASASSMHRLRRPQFLDESHVFWCASCKGDLIVL